MKDNEIRRKIDALYKWGSIKTNQYRHAGTDLKVSRDRDGNQTITVNQQYYIDMLQDVDTRPTYPKGTAKLVRGTDFDFFSEETADNFGAHCQHCHWCFTRWKDYVIPCFVETWFDWPWVRTK